ncbi:hypothetical protein DLAC_06035 [Tieghemostelium lacteum]|uniref:Uncharacterized protein n=1 Tax=Tieghemostelium lacteum TaxID=361077 RepID=A0A151ZHA0_TIELA|nr:hypothetical protein DLAC_06035 [Tieghemostelium lacteum]|eukprot:KYQ93361.1 hypothetical protein DLAC_06035 [Tieghemostelium lacteum]
MKIVELLVLLIFISSCLIQSDALKISRSNRITECMNQYVPEQLRDRIHLLEPDTPLNEQIITSVSKSQYHPNKLYYLLANLNANTQYSIRISYIASSPAEFSIEFFDNILSKPFEKILNNGHFSKSNNQRDLLNTEIIKFRTDSDANVIEEDSFIKMLANPCSIITIESLNAGITPSFVQENDINRLQSFNLVLDTEEYLIPPQLPKVIILALITVLILFVYLTRNIFPKIKKTIGI